METALDKEYQTDVETAAFLWEFSHLSKNVEEMVQRQKVYDEKIAEMIEKYDKTKKDITRDVDDYWCKKYRSD